MTVVGQSGVRTSQHRGLPRDLAGSPTTHAESLNYQPEPVWSFISRLPHDMYAWTVMVTVDAVNNVCDDLQR